MSTLIKVLIITLLLALVGGCIIGVVLGKRAVKKSMGEIKPVLSTKERIIYSIVFVLGAACICIGVFLVPRLTGAGEMLEDPMMGMEGEMYGPEGGGATYGDNAVNETDGMDGEAENPDGADNDTAGDAIQPDGGAGGEADVEEGVEAAADTQNNQSGENGSDGVEVATQEAR